tara:strand:- start:315 stop:539 length:225 start_codon:yes stop_codon:yes gene_type:complete
MSKYNICVWDIQFCKTDDDGNELLNPDGSVKLFRHKYDHDVSFIAEGTTEAELEEIKNGGFSSPEHLESYHEKK